MATKKTSAAKTSTAKVKKASAKAKVEMKEAVDAVEDVVDAVEDAVETAAEGVFAKVTANVQKAQHVAKQVWFAGLGAAGKTYEEVVGRYNALGDELQARYTKLNSDRRDLVEDLVARGEKVQDQAEARLKEGRSSIEDKIEEAKGKLVGLSAKVDIPARLQDLSAKLDSLSKDLKKSA